MIILLLFAFIGGIVTILSPCILPILPIVLSSSVDQGKSRPYGIVAGFVASFTFFTLFLTAIVNIFQIPADSLRLFSVIVIAVFGLSLVIPQAQKFIEIIFTQLQKNLNFNNSKREGFWGGVIIGLSLGLLWTPCVGPILASVITLALTGTVTGSAILITFAYALGTSIPMFMIIKGGQKLLQSNQWLLKNSANIQKGFGVVMIITALAIFMNWDRQFQTYVLQKFPQYGTGLTSIEDNQFIRNALDNFANQEDMDDMKGKSLDTLMNISPPAAEITKGGEIFNWNEDNISVKKLTSEGKVVLIDFWTYTCINCIRTLPYLRDWNEKYADDGLVIIGVHAPEFEFEKDPKNVAQAIEDFDIKYPVVQDNQFTTWKAYQNRYWPAKYLIDTNGRVRYKHFGEGSYDDTEAMIQELLNESGKTVDDEINNLEYDNYTKTPETYLGYWRMRGFASTESVRPDTQFKYSYPEDLSFNTFAYSGLWKVAEQYSESSENSSLKLNFASKDVFIVMSSESETEVEVYLDDEYQNTITVMKDQLYDVIKMDNPGNHILELKFKNSGTKIFAFTFG